MERKAQHEFDTKRKIFEQTLEVQLKQDEEKLNFELFKLDQLLDAEEKKARADPKDFEKIQKEAEARIVEREQEFNHQLRILQRNLEDKLEDLARDLLHSTSKLGNEFYTQFRNLKSEFKATMFKLRSDSERKKNEIRSKLREKLQDLRNSYTERIRNIQRKFEEKEESLIKACEESQKKACETLEQKQRRKRSTSEGSDEKNSSPKKVFRTESSDPVGITIRGEKGDLLFVRVLKGEDKKDRESILSKSVKKRSLQQELNRDESKKDSSSSSEESKEESRTKRNCRTKRNPQGDVGIVLYEECDEVPEVYITDDVQTPPIIAIIEKTEEDPGHDVKKRSPQFYAGGYDPYGMQGGYGGGGYYGAGGTDIDIDVDTDGFGGGYRGYGVGGMYGGDGMYGQAGYAGAYAGAYGYGGVGQYKRSVDEDYDQVSLHVEPDNPRPKLVNKDKADDQLEQPEGDQVRQKRSANPQYPGETDEVSVDVMVDDRHLAPSPYVPGGFVQEDQLDVVVDQGVPLMNPYYPGVVEDQVEVVVDDDTYRRKRAAYRNPYQRRPPSHPEFDEEVQIEVIDEPTHYKKHSRIPPRGQGEPYGEDVIEVFIDDDDGTRRTYQQHSRTASERYKRAANPQYPYDPEDDDEVEIQVEVDDAPRRYRLHDEDVVEVEIDNDRRKREAQNPIEPKDDADEVQVDAVDEPHHYREHSYKPGNPSDEKLIDVQVDDGGSIKTFEEQREVRLKRAANPQYPYYPTYGGDVAVDVVIDDGVPYYPPYHGSYLPPMGDEVEIEIAHDIYKRSPQYPNGYPPYQEFEFEIYGDSAPAMRPPFAPGYPNVAGSFSSRRGYPGSYPSRGYPAGGADIQIEIADNPYGRFKRNLEKNQGRDEKIASVKTNCKGCDKPVLGDVAATQN